MNDLPNPPNQTKRSIATQHCRMISKHLDSSIGYSYDTARQRTKVCMSGIHLVPCRASTIYLCINSTGKNNLWAFEPQSHQGPSAPHINKHKHAEAQCRPSRGCWTMVACDHQGLSSKLIAQLPHSTCLRYQRSYLIVSNVVTQQICFG